MVEPLHINPITLRMLGCYIVPVDTKSQEDQQIWSSATKETYLQTSDAKPVTPLAPH